MNSLHPVSLLKKVMPQDGRVRAAACEVSVGDRFEQQDEGASIWIVERISEVRMSSFPLVSLARVGHPDITKTVSLSTLSENIEYRLAG